MNDQSRFIPIRSVAVACLAVVFIVGIGLRIGAAMGDLWVDEIWSLDQIAVARASGAWADWIALYFHDNTHALNTLYLTALGPDASMIATRLQSLAFGIATIGVAAAIGWRRSEWEGVLLGLLAAISYPLVHYAGEARGYGPMLFAGFASFYALESWLEKPRVGWLIAFVVVSMLGLAAHLTFVVVQAGLGGWAALRIHARRPSIVSTIARLVPLFGIQLIALSAYGAVAINSFVIGGVTFIPALDAVGTMAALTFGFDPAGMDGAVLASMFSTLALAAIVCLRNEGDEIWILFAIIVVAFPLGAILIERQSYALPRYFIAAAPFALMLAARGVSALLKSAPPMRVTAIALIIGFCVGNGQVLAKFFDAGRGVYGEAISEMARSSSGAISVSGSPGFSVGTMFRYHARRLGLGERFQFVDAPTALASPPDWHIAGYLAAISPAKEIERGAVYELTAVYPHWGLSGDTWALYRRQKAER